MIIALIALFVVCVLLLILVSNLQKSVKRAFGLIDLLNQLGAQSDIRQEAHNDLVVYYLEYLAQLMARYDIAEDIRRGFGVKEDEDEV